jgi:putrescine transport system permease protein
MSGIGGNLLHRWFGRGWLALGYVFLYVPIVALVLYSFNDSPIPNVWRGFTFKWYTALVNDGEMLSGLWLSLKIALLTACGSVVLGTLAAFALVKYKRFTGRTMFSGMVNAPLVMPEVVVGLSLLLMLVSVQRAIGFPSAACSPSGWATCCWAWPMPPWWCSRACRI